MRSDDAAGVVTSRQNDAAMIHFKLRVRHRVRQFGPLDERTAAGWAPVRFGLFGQNGATLAADAFHDHQITGRSGFERNCLLGADAQYTGGMHPPVRLVAIDMDGTMLPTFSQTISQRNARALRSAQEAGITVAIATGRRTAYTAPLLDGLGLRADMPLITSNGAVTRTLGGQPMDRSHMNAHVARGLCGLLRKFGAVVFTFDRPGQGELVLEDMDQAHGRIALWVEANRNAIAVVNPLEKALVDGDDPIQGMVAGGMDKMRKAEKALKESTWSKACECLRTEYSSRDLSILDLLPPGVSKGWALERLAMRLGVDRKETMAIGDNWNDVDMLEWAGQGVMMGNAAPDLRALAKMRGWKQAPPNDEDGVAVVLEALVARHSGVSLKTRHWTGGARN